MNDPFANPPEKAELSYEWPKFNYWSPIMVGPFPFYQTPMKTIQEQWHEQLIQGSNQKIKDPLCLGPKLEQMAIENKAFRKEMDNILKKIKSGGKSRERSLALTKLEETMMWLGMDLKQIKEQLDGMGYQTEEDPYPNSKRPETGAVIDKTAEGLTFGSVPITPSPPDGPIPYGGDPNLDAEAKDLYQLTVFTGIPWESLNLNEQGPFIEQARRNRRMKSRDDCKQLDGEAKVIYLIENGESRSWEDLDSKTKDIYLGKARRSRNAQDTREYKESKGTHQKPKDLDKRVRPTEVQ